MSTHWTRNLSCCTSRALVVLLSISLVLFGLDALTPSARADTAPIPTCAPNTTGCTPPPLINPALLSNQSSRYFATPAQQASLQALESQAIANTLADHSLPASDTAAVQSWARGDAVAELFALVVQAIRTDAASRTTDQQNVVDWMTTVMDRHSTAVANSAGWEFLKWAGAVEGNQPMPSTATLLSDLGNFTSNATAPINFNHGTPQNSTSGFCLYIPPAPYQDQYTSNISTPPDRNTADSWCYPDYGCQDLLGCNDNEPSFDQFATWGEADADQDLVGNAGYASTGMVGAAALEFAAGAVAAGGIGSALAVAIGPEILASPSLSAAMFPFAGRAFMKGTTVLQAADPEVAAEMTAESVGAVVSIAIIAITIAVIKGLQVSADQAVPGQLSDLITKAENAQPDLNAMLNDSDELQGIYSMFIGATMPNPSATVCDNSSNPATPCLDAPPIPAPATGDPQFLIQQNGNSFRTDTLTWADGAPKPYWQYATADPTLWEDSARVSGQWFVTQSSGQNPDHTSFQSPWSQNLEIHFLDPNLLQHSAYVIRQDDGTYKFLDITGPWLFYAANDPSRGTFDPSTCATNTPNGVNYSCRVTDSVQMLDSSGTVMTVSLVPPIAPTVDINPTNAVEGTATQFTATYIEDPVSGDSQTSVQWYFEQADPSSICGTGFPCGYDGPYSGLNAWYTWQRAGTYHAVVLYGDAGGRVWRNDYAVTVGDVAPVIHLDNNLGTTLPDASQLTGSVTHTGSLDSETVTIDWGDGSSDSNFIAPRIISVGNPQLQPSSDTAIDFNGTHTYAVPGNYTATVTVTDEAGGTDTATFVEDVIGDQSIAFPAIADHTYGDGPVTISATGGGSGQPVTFTPTDPSVCTVSTPTAGTDSNGNATATASVTLLAAGTCTVTAHQAAGNNYLAAPDVAQTFSVDKAPLTVTANDQTMTLHGAVPALTFTDRGFVNGDTSTAVSGVTCSAVDGSGQPVGATTPVGSYQITCTGGSADNYAITYQPGTLHVVYHFSGFLAPLAGPGPHRVAAGIPVVLRWRLTDANGTAVVDPTSLSAVTTAPFTCGTTPPTGGAPAQGRSTLVRALGQWLYTWTTSRTYAGSCRAVTLHLNDLTTQTIMFTFPSR